MAQSDSGAGNTPSEQQAVSAVTVENAAAVAALLALEKETVTAATGPLRAALRNILRLLSGRYVLMFGSLEHPADPEQAAQLTQILVEELEHIRGYDPTTPLTEYADRARTMGVDYANRYLSDPVPESEVPVAPAVARTIAEAPAEVDRAIVAAQQYAEQTPIADWRGVVQQVGKASQAATGLDRRAAWALAAAKSSSIGEVTAARGAQLLWVAEPDACVVCLALSGHLSDPASGVGFDEFATFGKPGSAPGVWPPDQPLMGPPRHPLCRCVPELWIGPSVPVGGPEETSLYNRPGVGARVDLPAALRREAKRSIVYGWSVPSESGVVRIDAAARLLARGAGLPKSVEARGRAAVAAGKFDNRVHPSLRRTAHRST